MSLGPFDIGDVASLTLSVTAGTVAVDPGVVGLTTLLPDGTSGTPSVTKDSVGHYHCDITVTQAGQWKFRWTGTGGNALVEEGSFLVRPRAVP